MSNCVRSFETGESHLSDKILEEVTAIRRELRLERLERTIWEEEASRLRKEILCRLNVNQSTSDLIPVNRITQPLADVATQQVVSTATQLTTNIATQLPVGNEVTTITQPLVAPMAAPPNVLEGASESGGKTDEEPESMPSEEVNTAWPIPNHLEKCVPDEFVCRWTPCDVVFNTYGKLIQHIQTHQFAIQCKWSGCNDVVPVTEALGHLIGNRHRAHRDGICRWNDCLQKVSGRKQLNNHLRHCMNLQFSVFKCPWKDCHKYIKRYPNAKRHMVEFHWKLGRRRDQGEGDVAN